MANLDFSSYFKKSTESTTDNTKKSHLLEIQNSKELLDEKSIAIVIKDIKKLVCVNEEVFNNIYLKTIENYAEFVQSLPNIKFKNFDTTKGQLILSLIRTSITLENSEHFATPSSQNSSRTTVQNEQEDKRTAVWQYAIFSSSLLLDIGKALNRFNIFTCLENHNNSSEWYAISGPMTNSKKTHYYYEAIDVKFDEQNKSLTNKLNLLFSRLIIPDFILEWLYSEKDIFLEWINILEDESSGSGTLHALTVKSIRQLLNEYMGISLPKDIFEYTPHHINKKEEYHKNSFWKGVEHALKGKYNREKTDNLDKNIIGEEFVSWLQEGIKNKDIKVNTKDANVHISKEGVFLMTPEIFKEFCKDSTKYSNWVAVFKNFNQLGISSFSKDNSLSQAYFPNIDKNYLKNGIIIEDKSLIFKDQKSPGISPEIRQDPEMKIQNSSIFPSPREESGAFLRHVFKPKAE